MPAPSTFTLLDPMKPQFQAQRNAGNGGESLEAYRERMYQVLNEPMGYEELERSLPEEFQKYLILDAAEWAKREPKAVAARKHKVNTQLVYANRKEPEMPQVMGRGINSIAYYLEQSGQQELLKEFERIMSTEPDEERDREFRIKGAERGNEAEEIAYARGHMLARLSEKYINVKPSDLANLTEEQKQERMAELSFIYGMACNLDSVLKSTEEKPAIKFRTEDRIVCEHMRSLMEVTGAFDLELELRTNPCYKYLDLEKLFTEVDANQIGTLGVKLYTPKKKQITEEIEEIEEMPIPVGRLGIDFMNAGFRIQRVVGVRVEDELERLGFDLTQTRYTLPDDTPLDPLSVEGLSYVAMGGTFFAKDDQHALKVSADMTGKLQLGNIELEDYLMPVFRKALSDFGFRQEHLYFMKEDGSVWNPDNPKDREYYEKGNAVLVNQDEKQVKLQKRARIDTIMPICSYTKYYLRHEEEAVRADAERLKQEARDQNAQAEQGLGIFHENIIGSRNEYVTEKSEQLPEIREMLRRSDPVLMKSSPEYKSVKRALKAYAHMPVIDAENPESIQQAKEVLNRILENANTYLENKHRKSRHSRTESNRMVSIQRAQEFASRQLAKLNNLEGTLQRQANVLERMRAREAVIREQDIRIEQAIMKGYEALTEGCKVSEEVKKYFEEKWKAEEAVKAAAEPVIPAKAVIPEVPGEVKQYIKAQVAEENKEAGVKLEACKKKIDKITDEVLPEETAETVELDIELAGAIGEKPEECRLARLFTLSEYVSPKEQLTEELEKDARYFLSRVVLRRAMRNDQHVHKDNPTMGPIMQLSEKLSAEEYGRVIMATPTFKAMTGKLSKESLYDFVINLDTPNMKQQTLNIMNEIPATAKTLFAEEMVQIVPENIYQAMYGANEAVNPGGEAKNPEKAADKPELKGRESVKDKAEAKGRESVKDKPAVKGRESGMGIRK